jgi:hypothetical protein
MTSGLRWTTEAYEAYQKERHAVREEGGVAHSYLQDKPTAPRADIRAAALSADDARVLRAHASMQRFQALGRLPKDRMNATETAYAAVLEQRRVVGDILAWDFHPFNVRLASNTFYEIDWLVVAADRGVEIHETKGGFTTDKGQLKLKLCGERLPYFRMFKVTRLRKKDGGGWRVTEYSA